MYANISNISKIYNKIDTNKQSLPFINLPKLNLIVGNQYTVNKPAPKLTKAQIKERDELQKKSEKIGEKMRKLSSWNFDNLLLYLTININLIYVVDEKSYSVSSASF